MPLKPTSLTEEDKELEQLQYENELPRLNRQYCLLEKDRSRYYLSGTRVSKLQNFLSIFEKEHENILNDLEVATCPAKIKEDVKVIEEVDALLGQHEFLRSKIDQERKYQKEIDAQIRLVEKEVQKLQAKKKITGDFEDDYWKQREITMEKLENKLEVQMRKFGTTTTELKVLRERIKELLGERELFIKIWNKMLMKLQIAKRYLMDLIGQATIAYDEREEWCKKLQALREKAHYDYLKNVGDMEELYRRQNCNEILEEFFETKTQRRLMNDLEKKQEEKMKETIKNMESKLQQYKRFLDEVLQFTKESKMIKIAEKFYKQEEENFSHFKRLMDIVQEMEDMWEKLTKCYKQIDEKRALHHSREEKQNIHLNYFKEQLTKAKKVYKTSEKDLQNTNTYLQQMFQGIQKLFTVCQCNNDPILNLLGDNHTINPYNVHLYLELIEKNIHAALLEVARMEKLQNDKDKRKDSTSSSSSQQRITESFIDEKKVKRTIFPIHKLAGTTPCPICMEKEMVADVIEIGSLESVISRKEAIKRVHQNSSQGKHMFTMHSLSECNLPKSREFLQKIHQDLY